MVTGVSAMCDGGHSYAVFQKEMEEKLENHRYILDHFDQALEKGYIIDADHLASSISSSRNGYVQGLFRVRRDDGNYRWTRYAAVEVHDSDAQSLLLFESPAYFEDEKARDLYQVEEEQKEGLSH